MVSQFFTVFRDALACWKASSCLTTGVVPGRISPRGGCEGAAQGPVLLTSPVTAAAAARLSVLEQQKHSVLLLQEPSW